MEYIKSMLDPSATFSEEDGEAGGRRTRYLTPSDRRTMGFRFNSASTLRSPSSRHDSMSVHLAWAGAGRAKASVRNARAAAERFVLSSRLFRLRDGSDDDGGDGAATTKVASSVSE